MVPASLRERQLQCTGCGACANACPFGALMLKEDELGFLRPVVQKELCTECGVCEKVCPVLNDAKIDHEKAPECWAVWAVDEEIRQRSSSGGVFSVAAEEILKAGGVVFGAAIGENLRVTHQAAHTAAELLPLQKSKYAQSETGSAFQQAREALAAGKQVLYVGTPCQIAGLRAFLKGDPENLYTIDLICHGVPSSGMLRQEMEEKFGKGQVTAVDFRPEKGSCQEMLVSFKDGSQRRLNQDESFYEQAFHGNLSLRESCYQCKFCDFPRQGDLTLGDFWQIGEYDPALAREKGVSALLVNSAKGRELLRRMSASLTQKGPVDLKYLANNRIHPTIAAHPGRDYFLRRMKKHAFAQSARDALQGHYDVGLVGNWSYPNYGSSLTYYALYRVLTDMDLSVRMIGWPRQAQWKPYARPELFETSPYPEDAIAPLVERRRDMKRFNYECDSFVLGSDQLLNNNLYRWFDKFMQLDWVYATKRKIAYAASFGTDYTWGSPEEWGEMAYFMRQFDAFSVREDSGVSLARQCLGVTARQVLDPVFLAKAESFAGLAAGAVERPTPGPYLFSYTLDYTREKETALEDYAAQLGLDLHIAMDAAKEGEEEQKWRHEVLRGISTERWLAEIQGSRFMITDSFHGMCFAILFEIPFAAICNAERGETRFLSLLKQLGLEERFVRSTAELAKRRADLTRPIDYAAVSQKLAVLRRESMQWLKHALGLPVEKKILTGYDILAREQDEAEDRLNGRMDWAIGRIDQDKADINGRMDWAIGRIDQDRADINGRMDWAIGRIDQDRADINGRMDWAIGRIDQDRADINGRMDWAIGRIDQDRAELLQENERLKQELDAQQERLNSLEAAIRRLNAWWPLRLGRKIRGLFKKKG